MGAMHTRILVVDDDAGIRELLAEYLRGREFAVDVASDAATALAMIAVRPPDLVITDLRLPDADGLEVVEAAARANPPVPVVAATGYGSMENAVGVFRAGAADLLPKPFRLRDVYAAVSGALTRTGRQRIDGAALRLLESAALAEGESAAIALLAPLGALLEKVTGEPVRVWRDERGVQTEPAPPEVAAPWIAAVTQALARSSG